MAGIDHAPPPFFNRGPAPLALLTFYVAISIALFVIDLKYHSADLIRQAVAVVVDPLQRLAQTPGTALEQIGGYFDELSGLQKENVALRRTQLDTAPNLERLSHLEVENARLRRLLEMKEREKADGKIAHILYSTRDPFSRRIVIDKGLQSGINAGQPVIDESGVVGQVTRIFPLSAEVTLITDKDQVVPVQVARTGLRSIVYGLGDGRLELRYLPTHADIQEGDMLVTSGLDGVFLAGFPVARVTKVERDGAYSFARIFCNPIAGVENFGEVFVLNARPASSIPAIPASQSTAPSSEEDKSGSRPKKTKRPPKAP